MFRRLVAACLGVVAVASHAQTYPDKPIHFIVPFAAGSATDQLARAIGSGVTEQTKQPVVVENKPGANGFIAAEFVKKAAPDGYTVLITTNTTHAANEHLFKKMPYDPVKDFTPVTALGARRAGHDRQPEVPGQDASQEFIDAREDAAGQGDLRQRQLVEPRRRRAVPADGRGAAPARPLQEQPARDQRSPRRADRHDDHRHRDRAAAGERREAARARRVAAASARRSRPKCRRSTRPASRATR